MTNETKYTDAQIKNNLTDLFTYDTGDEYPKTDEVMNTARNVIRFLLAERQAAQMMREREAVPRAAVPDGWKLVPLIATREMLDAARIATQAANFRVDGEPTRPPVVQERILINAAYMAMLAAAPEVTE